MITFSKTNDAIYLNYTVDYGDENWVLPVLEKDGAIRLKKRTFYLESKYFVPTPDIEEDDEDAFYDPPIFQFVFANRQGNYFKVIPGTISRYLDIYFHKSAALDLSYFVADGNTSVFHLVENLVNEPMYIGGDQPTAIPIEAFELMVKDFPTPYEKKAYAEARISKVLKNYLDGVKDSESIYQRYMNKRLSHKGNDLQKIFKDMELFKYRTILGKLELMLSDEQDYPERTWQLEILQIVQLLYPKYISVLMNVPIRDKMIGDRILDFLLVDVNGHIDIIEIKKPFDNSIMTQGKHRNNYIPLRELSGTIMQLEKYVFYLNRWGADGERHLTEKYASDLPEDIEIKITNPGGLIIMGRDIALTAEQKLDFEVVKRKYKNVVDIITYDNLIHRLKLIIEQIQKV